MEPHGGASAVTAEAPQEAYRVTTLELFFDLVFVFTITQLTGVLAHELSPVWPPRAPSTAAVSRGALFDHRRGSPDGAEKLI
ncbi:low temperature requirement protein A [Actinoallomurus sp. NPDC052274]|uniref:low temperature requirement protein A n=1 Tax=Actinoallomurus sp. NPDC052274 TaxID=3155420 RepID=UPI003411F897